jgi:hypothetical protein
MRRNVSTLVMAGAALALLFGAAARPQPALPLSGTAQPLAAETPTPTPRPPAANASCEAASLAWLVGKPKSAIPVPVDPSLRRVYCSTCMVTQDYIPGRTDIVFDTETGLVTAVKCG